MAQSDQRFRVRPQETGQNAQSWGSALCCWRSADDGQGACFIFRLVAFVCSPGKNRRKETRSQSSSQWPRSGPPALSGIPPKQRRQSSEANKLQGREGREGAGAGETAEAGRRTWEQPGLRQRERPGDLRGVLKGLEPAGEALAPGGGGRAWPQQGRGAGSRARAGHPLLPPHRSRRARWSAGGRSPGRFWPCLPWEEGSGRAGQPPRTRDRGRPGLGPGCGDGTPGGLGGGGRSRGEVKAETEHVGGGLCGPGRGSASQHQSQGPTRPRSQS